MVTLLIRNTSESKALLQIAVKAAQGLEHDLSLILFTRKETSGLRPLKEKDSTWMHELSTEGVSEILVCGGAGRYAHAEKHLEQTCPELLIIGKHFSANAETEDGKYSRGLYETLSCQTLLVRLGDTEEKEDLQNSPILVSCGGGPHTARALKLAYAITGPDTVAMHLTADVDEVSEEAATTRLRKIIRKAGIDPDAIQHKIILGTDFPQALQGEVTAGIESVPYSMVILGYTENRTIREKLFGTISEKLIRDSGGLRICAIRGAKPARSRLASAFEKRIRLSIPQLERDDRIALFEDIEQKSIWCFDFAALMTLAALVAGLGLMANSGAVVIGAMLIAPLMMPLIGCGLALAQGHTPLFKSAFHAVVKGFLFALVSGLLLGLLSRGFHIPLTSELAARGTPSLLDLGIAFVSGIAASYCIARPNLTGALAGVAIAAALVPPIVTTGICLTMGEFDVAKGAGLLFGTNVVAVIFGASLNFILAGIVGQGKDGDKGRRFIFILALGCLGLAVPLTSVLIKNIPKLEASLAHLPTSEAMSNLIEEALPQQAALNEMTHSKAGGAILYQLSISAPYPLNQEHFQTIKAAITSAHDETEVKVSIESKIILGDLPKG